MADTNTIKAEGLLDEAKGKLKDGFGGLTGDASTQAEGKFDQLSGIDRKSVV